MKKVKRKLIIDTDPGHDDVLAIMLLTKSEKFDVQAITTVAGNSSIENVTRNAFFLKNLLDSPVPIFSGQKMPLYRDLIQATVHGNSGLDGIDTSKTAYILTADADKQIAEIIKSNPSEVTVLALGPLTNIATAFINNQRLSNLANEIVIMGGAIDVPGNMNRVAEFNIFVDPEAADIVFRSGIRKVLIPLDVCNKVIFTDSDFEKLKSSSLYPVIKRMMKKYIKAIRTDTGLGGAVIYDAVAAYYLINPKAFKLESMNIAIETKGEHTRGMTIAEKRLFKQVIPNTFVAMDIDVDQLKSDFIRILNS